MSGPQTKQIESLDQVRARLAWELVAREKRARTNMSELTNQAKKLPTRILACGLGQAIAFTKAKGPRTLLDGLTELLSKRMPPTAGEPTDVMERIVKTDALFLRRATAEALAYLPWVARFAEAASIGEEG